MLDALRMALSRRRSGANVQLVHHSDAGSQYTSYAFGQVLDDHPVLGRSGPATSPPPATAVGALLVHVSSEPYREDAPPVLAEVAAYSGHSVGELAAVAAGDGRLRSQTTSHQHPAMRSRLVPSRRELPLGEDARLSKEQRASRSASLVGCCSVSFNSIASGASIERRQTAGFV